jgi:hypothetical protein
VLAHLNFIRLYLKILKPFFKIINLYLTCPIVGVIRYKDVIVVATIHCKVCEKMKTKIIVEEVIHKFKKCVKKIN